MTPERLDAIEALCEAATPGPWQARGESTSAGGINILTSGLNPDGWEYVVAEVHGDAWDGIWRDKENAALIAAAPAAILELLAEVKRLQAELGNATKLLADLEPTIAYAMAHTWTASDIARFKTDRAIATGEGE